MIPDRTPTSWIMLRIPAALKISRGMALIYGLNRVIMESRRNNGLYDDEVDDEEEYDDYEDDI